MAIRIASRPAGATLGILMTKRGDEERAIAYDLNASSSGRHDDATVAGVATYSEKAAAGGESG
jgi:hypothetical protein